MNINALEYLNIVREAFHQLDWGTDVHEIESALAALRSANPKHALIGPLQAHARRLLVASMRAQLGQRRDMSGVVVPFPQTGKRPEA